MRKPEAGDSQNQMEGSSARDAYVSGVQTQMDGQQGRCAAASAAPATSASWSQHISVSSISVSMPTSAAPATSASWSQQRQRQQLTSVLDCQQRLSAETVSDDCQRDRQQNRQPIPPAEIVSRVCQRSLSAETATKDCQRRPSAEIVSGYCQQRLSASLRSLGHRGDAWRVN